MGFAADSPIPQAAAVAVVHLLYPVEHVLPVASRHQVRGAARARVDTRRLVAVVHQRRHFIEWNTGGQVVGVAVRTHRPGAAFAVQSEAAVAVITDGTEPKPATPWMRPLATLGQNLSPAVRTCWPLFDGFVVVGDGHHRAGDEGRRAWLCPSK